MLLLKLEEQKLSIESLYIFSNPKKLQEKLGTKGDKTILYFKI